MIFFSWSIIENETTLFKFFLIAFIQKNTPSHLSKKFYSFNFLINHLKNNELEFSYANLKKLLIEIAPLENHQNTYAHIKFLLKLLILEDFPNFDIEDDYELEFIPRPKSFNSNYVILIHKFLNHYLNTFNIFKQLELLIIGKLNG